MTPTDLGVNVTSWQDNTVTPGVGYEYFIQIQGRDINTVDGYIYTGIDLPAVDSRGKIILVVENSIAGSISIQLDRLKNDLVAEGWTVIQKGVSKTDSPQSVRSTIQSEYNNDTANVKSVLLIGHVPVPHSGWTNQDGHGFRPAPADNYYGEMDGSWTDSGNWGDNRSSDHMWWVNVPNDGKFDQTFLPSDVDLEVGRIDMANMPSFQQYGSMDEASLLRRYLDKDHQYRTAQWDIPRNGATMESDSAKGYQRPFFGPIASHEISLIYNAADGYYSPTFWNDVQTNPYLWFSRGGGGGFYSAVTGIGSTYHFAQSPGVKTVFYALYASYFSEWDVDDALLRAPLAALGYGLTAVWSDNPAWSFQHMGLGKTIGYSTRISQNNDGYYLTFNRPTQSNHYRRGPYIGLMGDPTLRMFPVKAPSNFTVNSISGGNVQMSWSAPAGETVAGYHVYRGKSSDGPFTRVSPATPITATTFTDSSVPNGTFSYLVKTIKLETTGSGTYFNDSPGVLVNNVTITNGGGTPPQPTAIHPADGDEDSFISQNEVTKYGYCWKKIGTNPYPSDCPTEVNVDLATRAGMLYSSTDNGRYRYAPAHQIPLCWEVAP